MVHKCSVGQLVHATGTHFADRTSGVYEVVCLTPENNGHFRCGITNVTGGCECAGEEPRIRAVDARRSIPAPHNR